MIDYDRLERGARGVDRRRTESNNEVDELTAATSENARLRKVIDVQKTEINRLMRLLGMGLQQK
ncbi:MAG TPA: hypothetical protein VMB49_13195 [Acidobacteriaceae bacterium]|nr:hypothetical protein [Acidobacteriaceae bacterium]